MKTEITKTQFVAAPPARVFKAFTVGTAMRAWLSDVAITSARAGGHLFLAWNDGYYAAGAFTTLEEPMHVAFAWQGSSDPGPTRVDVRLAEVPQGTEVTVVHSGIGAGEAWETLVGEFSRAWEASLENLASVYGAGPDLRIVRRPMLGVVPSDLDESIAANLGVPVTKGMRLDDIVEGMGAAAAGLQHDDVLVELAGQPVSDWASLTSVLSAHQAGDEVAVTFYRGPDRREVLMRLSGRRIPEIPGTTAELAEKLAAHYDEAGQVLDAFLDGVGEAEADFRPGEEAWSVKETLAHLIHGERGWQNYIGEIVSGQEPWYDDYGGNLPARNTATVAAYPTLAALREVLGRLQTETIALARALPETLPAEKDKWWRLAYYMLEPPYHFTSHLEQMKAAVASAREAVSA